MTEPDARRLLAALAGRNETADESGRSAGDGSSYREIIDEATSATENFESAAAFLADHDLEELDDAIERAGTDLSARADKGREALGALRRLRAAAAGSGQFQSGRSSPLGAEDLADSR